MKITEMFSSIDHVMTHEMNRYQNKYHNKIFKN